MDLANNTFRRCLVTGGAGFLGINLVRYLLERGHEVTSLDLLPFDYPERDRIREVTGDIRDRATVDRAAEDCDLVVHCAAALPLYTPEEIMSTDLETIHVDESVEVAIARIGRGEFHALLVVDDDENLAGIVTNHDLLQYLMN